MSNQALLCVPKAQHSAYLGSIGVVDVHTFVSTVQADRNGLSSHFMGHNSTGDND